IGDFNGLSSRLLQPRQDFWLISVTVILLEVPTCRSLPVVYHQPARGRIQIGLVFSDPKIDVDGCGVRMNVQSPPGAVMLERPSLGQPMVLKNQREFHPQLVGDLKQQGRGESVSSRRAAVPVLVVLLPDRGFSAKTAKRIQCRLI